METSLFVSWFLQIAGLIIGLGSVTVIDILGFKSRKDSWKTQVTIEAHYTTKPLIWVGTILVTAGLVFLILLQGISNIRIYKLFIISILIINGSFLSFIISPALSKLKSKKQILPNSLQRKITVSMLISFIGWWSFVFLTVLEIIKWN
jgi:hypothetical protein